jgi:hypothetical protein
LLPGRERAILVIGSAMSHGVGQTHGAPVRHRRGSTECALCGQTLFGISPESKVRKVIVGSSGEQNMRAVLVDGTEIHRCPALGHPTGAATRAV